MKKDYKFRVMDLLMFWLKDINLRYGKNYHLNSIKSIEVEEDYHCCIDYRKIAIKMKRSKKVYTYEVMDYHIMIYVDKINVYLDEIIKDYEEYLKFIGVFYD